MSHLDVHEGSIAIVGATGRFPGAADLEAFWANLRAGVESVSFFTPEELRELGVDPSLVQRPDFVPAAPVLEDADCFDAALFGYSPREAALLDPQHRQFLEVCWAALETAAIDPTRFDGLIGVFAGMSMSSYLLFNLLGNPYAAAPEDSFQLMIGTDKDFLATRASYHLDLRGPSLDVQTGCSTSLVAVHLACDSLLSFQCDVALAGGISIQVPQRRGHLYQEGGVASPDGHTRAFDARGAGTIFGSGAGVVVLKRLADALDENDTILAVIRGSAINNDGAHKVGFTAPGVNGQAEVIARAQAVAGVRPDDIDYVEAHGTGTPLGDPIEVLALEKAFASSVDRRAFCGLGSVKTNIGHLDAAAGVAGLIKTVLALQHDELPPSLNFDTPNPKIDFDQSPFYVVDRLRPWPRSDVPRRAGVSSFGIGGTNAHVVVEEAPAAPPSAPGLPWQILPLSARSASALEEASVRLARWLDGCAGDDRGVLADVAATLQTGRRRLPVRRAVLADTPAAARAALDGEAPGRVWTAVDEGESRPVVFMFPGGGTQHPGMARDLARELPLFAEHLDHCLDLAERCSGQPLRWLLDPPPEREDEAARRLREPSGALLPLFSVEYALARTWMDLGVEPEAMIGHSLGECVAATVAGVFELEDALTLVERRGSLLEEIESGAMLSLSLPESEITTLLGDQLEIAAINGPSQVVVTGPTAAVAKLAERLERDELEFRHVQVSVAAHSRLIEPILPRFEAAVRRLTLKPPRIPYLSNVTGTWITPEQATDPAYWARHLRHTVSFGPGMATLLADPDRVLLEIGPGRSLATLANLQIDLRERRPAITTLPHPNEGIADTAALVTAAGKLWMSGVDLDWRRLHGEGKRRKLPLPTYPFERQRLWIEPAPAGKAARVQGKDPDLDAWFYEPSWRLRSRRPARAAAIVDAADTPDAVDAAGSWLILGPAAVGEALAAALRATGAAVARGIAGDRFATVAAGLYTLDPERPEHYGELLQALEADDSAPLRIVHLWSREAGESGEPPADGFAGWQARGFFSLLALTQAIAAAPERPIDLQVVADRLFAPESGDLPRPEKATLLGPALVAPQEVPGLTCRVIDPGEPGGDPAELAERLLPELRATESDPLTALRGRHRWVRHYEPLPIDGTSEGRPGLRPRGVYLITGGMGGVGLHLAGYLARTLDARLVLLGRTPLPDRADWRRIAELDHPQAAVVARLLELEEAGSEVWPVAVDVADAPALAAVVEEAGRRFGRIDGVIHAAGRAGADTVKLLRDVDRTECEAQFRAKVHGLYALEEAFADVEPPDFFLLFSSNVAVLGGLGAVAYSAANQFMDSFASDPRRRGRWLSIDWDGWLFDGGRLDSSFQTSMDRYAMAPDESVEAFRRVVEGAPGPHLVVSTGDLEQRLAVWTGRHQDDEPVGASAPRPSLASAYLPPENEVEETIAAVWQELLGIDEIGVQDNFFDLGGNSLIGLKVVAQLNQRLGIDMPITHLFQGPTVRALAQVVADGGTDAGGVDDSESRGARRRARRQRRRSAGAVEREP